MDTVLYKLLTHDKQARIFLIDNTAMVNAAQASSEGVVLDVFNTVLTFTSILHGMFTNAKRVSVKLETSDPEGFMLFGADANGNVQGYVSDELISRRYNGLKEMAGDIGCLKIVYDNGADAVFTGIIEIKEDDIAQNLSRYFLQSEQTESIFRYYCAEDGPGIRLSRGILVQALPFAEKPLISKWAARLEKEKSVIAGSLKPAQALPNVFLSEADVTEQWPVRLKCSCDRQSVLFMLMGLGVNELEWTIDENQDIEVKCGKCGERYGFGADEIRNLIDAYSKEG